jgi:CBS domain-containing protein
MPTRNHSPLPMHHLRAQVQVPISGPQGDAPLSMDSPALDFYTDLTRVPAATIEESAMVDDANRTMIRRGVRSLLVIDHERRLLGLLTATDVISEKPVQVAQQHSVPLSEVQVRDIMTPTAEIEAFEYEDFARAAVGRVVTALRNAGRQHGLVVRRHGNSHGHQLIQGIVSLTQIASALGVAIDLPGHARSFAEIEAAIRA